MPSDDSDRGHRSQFDQSRLGCKRTVECGWSRSGLCRAAQRCVSESEQRRNCKRSGRPAPRKGASTVAVSRPQASNEDLSDCAEACPSAKQPVFTIAPGLQRGSAFGKREGRRSAADRRPSGRREQRGDEALRKAPERGCGPLLGVGASRLVLSQKAHRRSAEGTGPHRPGASGRSALQDPRQGSLPFDTRMRNDIPYPLRPSLTSPDERGG